MIPNESENLRPAFADHAKKLNVLDSSIRMLSSETDAVTLLTAVIGALRGMVSATRVSILAYDSQAKTFSVEAFAVDGAVKAQRSMTIPGGHPTLIQALETRAQVLVNTPDAIWANAIDPIYDETMQSQLVLPLITKATFEGVLVFASQQKDAFTTETISFLQEIAERIAFAVYSVRLGYEAERNRKELDGLYEISKVFSAMREPSDSYEILTRTLAQLVGAERAVIVLRDKRTGRIRPVKPAYGMSEDDFGKLESGFEKFPQISELFRTGRPVRWNSPDNASEFYNRMYSGKEITAVIGAPMRIHDEIIGAIYCANNPRGFTEEDERLLSTFAHQSAVAIANSENYKQVRRQAEREQLLNHINSAISKSLNLDEILQVTVDELGRAATANSCVFYSLDANGSVNRIYCYRGSSESSATFSWPTVDPDNSYALEIPVMSGNRLVGRLALRKKSGETWFEDDIDLAKSVADHLSIAIQNSELFQETHNAALRLELLNRLGSRWRGGAKISELIQLTAESLGRLLKVSLCKIVLYSAVDASPLEAEFSGESSFTRRTGKVFDPKNPFLQFVLNKGETLAIENIEESLKTRPLLDSMAAALLSIDARSLLVSPILASGESVGLLFLLQTGNPREWEKSEIELVQAIAGQIASVVEQTRLNESLDESAKEAIALYQASNALALSLNLDELLTGIIRVMQEVLAYQSGALLLFNDDQSELYMRATFGMDQDPIGLRLNIEEPGIVTEVARIGSPLNIFDVRTDFRYISTRAATKSELAVPLKIDNEVIGVLEVEADTLGAFRDRDVNLLTAFAHKVAIAIRQVRLFEQVSRSKEEWETTFDAMKDAIFIFDRNAKVVRTNSAASELVRWDEQRVKTPGAPTYFLGGDELIHSAMNEKQTVDVEIECPPLGRLFHTTVYPILDGDDAAIGAVKIVHDLTILRSAERDARENQQFAAELVENVYDSIFTTDLHGRINWLNQQTCSITGYTESELIGQNFKGLVISEEGEKIRFNFACAIQGHPQGFETRLAHKNGEVRILLVTFTPFRRRQRIVGVLGIARDVTEQRRVQINNARSDKLHALGELASGVAHDFNNILAAILGRAQLMKTFTSDERLQRNLDIITQAAMDGGNTIKRIQNFTRRRADRDFLVHDINRLVSDAVDITRTRWKDESELAGRRIDVKTGLSSEMLCAGDATELREVFINLILNAVDAMPGGGELSITTESEDESCVIRFKDTGEGMPEEVRSRVFDPFFTTKGVDGNGLGLSVSYGIVTRHNGRIEVESKVGAGTTFTIILPLVNELPEFEVIEPESRAVSPARILVVDDESTVREILADILQSQGHSVMTADGGRRALSLLNENKFDIIFTDLGMPEMNGWEVAKFVKLMHPHMPVIMTTGWGEEIDPAKAALEGVDHVVAKPFQMTEILELVAQVFPATGIQSSSEGDQLSYPAI